MRCRSKVKVVFVAQGLKIMHNVIKTGILPSGLGNIFKQYNQINIGDLIIPAKNVHSYKLFCFKQDTKKAFFI